MGFEAAALEGGFSAWKDEYAVEPAEEQVGAP